MRNPDESSETAAVIVARHWDLNGVRVGDLLQAYSTRAVYPVDAEQGRFVIKIYDAHALGLVAPSDENVRQRLEVFDYLREKRFPHAPSLLKTRTGATFVRDGGKTSYIMERLDGQEPPASPETWQALGAIAAQLRSLSDFPYPYPIAVSGVLPALHKQASGFSFGAEFLKIVTGLEKRLPAALECPLPINAPALIHGEINTANAFLGSNGTMYLLDWDAVGTGPAVLIAAYPLLICFVDEDDLTFHRDRAEAFYAAYFNGETVTAEDKETLFDVAVMHALRYVRFHNAVGRWARIKWALQHKDLLLSAF